MAEINLDQLRRVREEASPKAARHTVTFGGKKFQMPKELPISFGIALGKGDIEGALEVIFNGKSKDFLAENPTMDDFTALANEVATLYVGVDLPESAALASSSKNTGTRSRQTSRGSTA